MTKHTIKLLFLLSLLNLTSACAEGKSDAGEPAEQPPSEVSTQNAASVQSEAALEVTDEQKAQVLRNLQQVRPDLQFTQVRATADPALFEVEYNNGPVIYVTASGNLFLVGDLFSVDSGRIVNLTEQSKSSARVELLEQVKPEDMISFGPAAEKAKAQIYVFTDVDCGYCRKLHDEMDDITAYGIRVNYLAYPRAGPGSAIAKQMQSAWCSANPQESLTRLKSGKDIDDANCESTAVTDQFFLGQKAGVSGTPALLLSDGTLIPGYRPATDLARMLGLQ